MEQDRPSTQEQEIELKKARLRSQLESHGIPLNEWGQGKAKTFDHLFKEVEEGETELVGDPDTGELLRKVSLTGVDVFYEDDTGRYKLVEDKQVFKDGRERKRNLDTSLSEKMKPGENPNLAAQRALTEELRISGVDKLNFNLTGQNDETITSPSYPGLKSRYTKDVFQVKLNSEQYNPDGYVEEQEDKSTFFVWQKED